MFRSTRNIFFHVHSLFSLHKSNVSIVSHLAPKFHNNYPPRKHIARASYALTPITITKARQKINSKHPTQRLPQCQRLPSNETSKVYTSRILYGPAVRAFVELPRSESKARAAAQNRRRRQPAKRKRKKSERDLRPLALKHSLEEYA